MDGSDAHETVNFSLDGTGYEIDLSSPHAGELRSGVATFVQHARKLGRTGALNRAAQQSAARNTDDTAEVRAWLVDNGYGGELKDRGRIPGTLRRWYETRTPKADLIPERTDVDAAAAELVHFVPPAPPEPPAATAKDEERVQRSTRAKRKPAKEKEPAEG